MTDYPLDLYDDAELYDRLSAPAPASEAFYVELARGCGGDVLEFACGTGRLVIPIARAGVRVAGVDLMPPMLARARAKAEAAGVEVELRRGDMRDADLGRRFALVFVAFNSMLHLTTTADLLAFLANVRRHLAPGGTFAFDIFNPSVRFLARAPGERAPSHRLHDDALGEIVVESTSDYDAATQVNRSAFVLSAPGRPDFRVLPIHLRSIFPQELPLLLERAGFTLEHRWGDFGREPFASASPRQVCVALTADG